MSLDHPPYPNPAAVDAAIKQAGKNAHAKDPTLDVTNLIRQAYFDRFLCRVFADGSASEWVLKGASGLLARIPNARATKDVDLYRASLGRDEALADLLRLAAVDLGDYFRFQYRGHSDALAGENQPGVEGYGVSFEILLGGRSKGSLSVDLVVHSEVTGEVQSVEPANRLDLPRLVANPYRLFPVVDHITDKLCATISDYEGRASTREWDLVDLVVFALTQDVDATALDTALRSGLPRNNLDRPTRFAVPSGWGPIYSRRIRETPFANEFGTVPAALGLMRRFLDPVLDGSVTTGAWSHHSLTWE
jgi:hypothetical protein